jgi:hypothetical protein
MTLINEECHTSSQISSPLGAGFPVYWRMAVAFLIYLSREKKTAKSVSEMGMMVKVHSGCLLACGLLAVVLSIECAPCAHGETHESLGFTLPTQAGGQEKSDTPAGTRQQCAYSPSLPAPQKRTALGVRQSQCAADPTALRALVSQQENHAAASPSTRAASKTASVNSRILDPIIDEHQDASPTASPEPSSIPLLPNNDGPNHATLPDAPVPQERTQSAPQPSVSGPQINQLSVLPPRLISYQLDAYDKFYIYVHEAYGPPAVILPTIGSGLGMINPKRAYPKEWKDGAGAFGRLYGDSLARNTSKSTAEFLTDAILHEDPRYLRSKSTGALGRTFHALAFTLFDKTDSGKTTLAISHFAGAAADGFVGMAYRPAGFNDLTHAGQRMTVSVGATAIGNIFNEFEPEWGPLYEKLHIPKILPTWWVPEHR